RPRHRRRDPRIARAAQSRVPEDDRDGHPRPPGRAACRQGAAPRQGAARARRPERAADRGRVMKYLTYIVRNARRNPVRSSLTIASMAISLFLMMILVSFFAMNREVAAARRGYHRLITMNSQGLTGFL